MSTMCASPTPRRVIAPAWTPELQALARCVLPLASPAGANSPFKASNRFLGGGRGDGLRDMVSHEIAKPISRTAGIGIADAVRHETPNTQEAA